MRRLIPFALGASLALGACQSLDTRPNQGPCPAAGSVYEAARVVKFDGGGELYTNITYTGEILEARLFCRYVEDDPIEAELELDFGFGKGPAATENRHTYRYFVAVTRTNRAVIEKSYFDLDANFRNQDVVFETDRIQRIVIPRADETISGVNFEILVGFDLTDEEYAFNTAGKRFRLDAGQ